MLLAVTGVSVFALSSPFKESEAAPFLSCDTNGILYQYPGGSATEIFEIDMVTGGYTQPPASPINNREINAIGYNLKDNFIYGWDHA